MPTALCENSFYELANDKGLTAYEENIIMNKNKETAYYQLLDDEDFLKDRLVDMVEEFQHALRDSNMDMSDDSIDKMKPAELRLHVSLLAKLLNKYDELADVHVQNKAFSLDD